MEEAPQVVEAPQDEPSKKGSTKVDYPSKPENGFDSHILPEDYDLAVYKRPGKADFANPLLFYKFQEHQIRQQFERRLAPIVTTIEQMSAFDGDWKEYERAVAVVNQITKAFKNLKEFIEGSTDAERRENMDKMLVGFIPDPRIRALLVSEKLTETDE